MKRTFTTVMPDRIGAFLKASSLLTELGLNITRVSYNKAVDVHMLFIEADGEEELLDTAERRLTELGYIRKNVPFGNVLLIEFRLLDEPGRLAPVLELIRDYSFNISYMSSQSGDDKYQYFKIGLYVEDGEKISEFMHRAALLCRLRVLEYSKSEKVLDNTVFYLSFAQDIAEKASLDSDAKEELIINSNLIMQLLDEGHGPAYKTFDYIGRFADCVSRAHELYSHSRVTCHLTSSGVKVLLIEPPCGSNTCIMEKDGEYLAIDSGFCTLASHLSEMITESFPDFYSKKRSLILTHADADHCGITDSFDVVYASQRCFENFVREHEGRPAWREENPTHAPYAKISKLITGYTPPKTENFCVIGNSDGESLMSFIGELSVCGMNFEVYEGAGGHAPGEIVLINREDRIAFTGDIIINVKDCTKEQAAFNRLAPYLMTSVDTDPELARRERKEIYSLLGSGEWTIFGGHGAPMRVNI